MLDALVKHPDIMLRIYTIGISFHFLNQPDVIERYCLLMAKMSQTHTRLHESQSFGWEMFGRK